MWQLLLDYENKLMKFPDDAKILIGPNVLIGDTAGDMTFRK